MFENLYIKYGDEFNWYEIMKTDTHFLDELNSELNEKHPLYKKAIKAVAKCDSNDDVLFLLNNNTYAIIHLTYSKDSTGKFPLYINLANFSSAIKYIEEQLINN